MKNVIALCEQCEYNKQADDLAARCKRALVYRDVSIKFTKKDKEFLKTQYDEKMDEDALSTLKHVIEDIN